MTSMTISRLFLTARRRQILQEASKVFKIYEHTKEKISVILPRVSLSSSETVCSQFGMHSSESIHTKIYSGFA